MVQERNDLIEDLGLNVGRETLLSGDGDINGCKRTVDFAGDGVGGAVEAKRSRGLSTVLLEAGGDDDLVHEVLGEGGDVDLGGGLVEGVGAGAVEDVDLIHQGKCIDVGEVCALGLTEGDTVGIDGDTGDVLLSSDVSSCVSACVVYIAACTNRSDHGLKEMGSTMMVRAASTAALRPKLAEPFSTTEESELSCMSRYTRWNCDPTMLRAEERDPRVLQKKKYMGT